MAAIEIGSRFKKEANQMIRKDKPTRIRIFNHDIALIDVVNSDILVQAMDGNQKVTPKEALMIKTKAMIIAIQSSDSFIFRLKKFQNF